ncbi:MAG TPA: YceI family protein [Actinomycetota bacterium]
MAGAKKRLVWVGGGLLLVVAAFVVVYFTFFRGDNKAPVSLSTTDSPKGSAGSEASVGDPAGTWQVVKGDNTFAGYRVREKLAKFPAQTDAVGQTHDVIGSMKVQRTAEGYTISGLQMEANLQTLKSNEKKRDQKIRTIGLQTDQYPKATFVAAGPVSVPAAALAGPEMKMDLQGDLTVHGVTKRVTIPVQAKVAGDQIEVVGSLTFPMSDFSIEPPSIPPFVQVEPQGTMEFKVRLVKT